MTTIEFSSELTYAGDKATVSAVLLRTPVQVAAEMILDTGAAISLLNRRFAVPMGLSITDGEPITLMVANGEVERAWIHRLTVDVLGRRLIVPVAICTDWDTQNLFGMRGFFDQIVVAFDHANRTIHF